MSYVTPNKMTTRNQRASESKRALFQQPSTMSSSYCEDSSDDSCDLGIMSTIDTDSSDIDQFVPVTPNSWRASSDRKKTVKEILKSPLTFKNYPRHCSRSSVSSRLTDFLADTESCSSSLKDLRFHSDSDLSDASGRTPDRRSRKLARRYPLRNYNIRNKEHSFTSEHSVLKKALKSLDFEQTDFSLPDEIKDSNKKKTTKSPLKMLKTPHESVTNVKKSPPRIHHKSLKENVKSVESSSTKTSRLSSVAPKARLSLFGSNDIKLSPKSFYPKPVVGSDVSKYHNVTWPSSKQTKVRKQTRHSHKKSRKPCFGDINKGVWHGILKPKQKPVSKEKALNMALKIIENSKLNDYIEQFMSSKKSSSKENNSEPPKDIETERDILQVNQTLKQFGCNVSVENLVNNVTRVNELATTFQVNKPIDLKKSLAPPKPVYDLNRSLISNHSYDLNQSFDNLNRSTDLNMSFTESEFTYDDLESVASDFDTASMSRKIFKARTVDSRKAVCKMRNLKLEIDNGKIHVPQKKQTTNDEGVKQIWNAIESKISNPIHLDASDLLTADEDEEEFRVPGLNAIESLLGQWSEEEVPSSEPQMESIQTVSSNSTPFPNYAEQWSTQTSNLVETDNANTNQRQFEDNVDSFDQMMACESNDNATVQTEVWTNDKKRKLYPIFDKDEVKAKQAKYEETSCVSLPLSRVRPTCSDRDQYIIDAGQKKFGVTQCGECGVIYHIGDPGDERDHKIYHSGLNVLKFNGWKAERQCGTWNSDRVIVIQTGDAPAHWRKVDDFLERIVHPQLGYAPHLPYHQNYKVYLYIENKQIIGCIVAESLKNAFKMIPDTDCISTKPQRVKCGISRLWTHVNKRRKNIATRLVDCLRANFYHGHILQKDDIAFSAPTPSGKAFAQKYIGRQDFCVYLETDVNL